MSDFHERIEASKKYVTIAGGRGNGITKSLLKLAYEQGRADRNEEFQKQFKMTYADAMDKARADAIDAIIRAEKNKYFCVEDLCTGAKDCSDCRVEYLEKLKEHKNGK